MNTKLFVLGLALTVSSYAQQGVGVFISPAPIYPIDGKIGPEMSNQYVFLDPQTLDLIVANPAGAGGARTFQKLELGTHVLPTISAQVNFAGGTYTYVYAVANGAAARQSIHRVYITSAAPVPADPRLGPSASQDAVPAGWTKTDYSYRPGQWAVLWERQTPAVAGNAGRVTLTVTTNRLPGLGQGFFEGQLSGPQSPSGLPDAALEQLALFQQLEFNSVPITTVVPKFDPSTPKAVIAADYHVHCSACGLERAAPRL
jgi:hypothetical protein